MLSPGHYYCSQRRQLAPPPPVGHVWKISNHTQRLDSPSLYPGCVPSSLPRYCPRTTFSARTGSMAFNTATCLRENVWVGWGCLLIVFCSSPAVPIAGHASIQSPTLLRLTESGRRSPSLRRAKHLCTDQASALRSSRCHVMSCHLGITNVVRGTAARDANRLLHCDEREHLSRTETQQSTLRDATQALTKGAQRQRHAGSHFRHEANTQE